MTVELSAPSRTAVITAIARGQHRLQDPTPWVFDDPFALSLAGPCWPHTYAMVTTLLTEPVLRQAIGLIVGRSRYAEDWLAAGDFTQYVILGAGLDSFAWRRPDVLHSVRVFEVDHPATQTWKRHRVEELALPTTDRHVFVPTDFETATLRAGLDAAGFDATAPTLFSWLGVTIYLTVEAIEATLRTVASCGTGSEIVLSYSPTAQFVDELGQQLREQMAPVAATGGEVFQTLLSPSEAEQLIDSCGLSVADHPTRDDLHERYFSRQSAGLTPPTSERLIAASVGAAAP
jgi:methyltransferase (TIGR00027 family)